MIEVGNLRFGVAFSFEPSRSLPDIAPLVPKVALFNEYLQANLGAFAGLSMWHHPPDADRPVPTHPGPIPDRLVRRNLFVFLGALGRSSAPNYDVILETLDRLLPLYRFVETGDGRQGGGAGTWTEPPLRMRPPLATRWTQANMIERKLDVELRHRVLQGQLVRKLAAEFGADCVGEEHPAPGGGIIDVIVRTEAEQVLFEIKTASTARGCIREAMEQVLDYARWPDGWPGGRVVDRVVVVGAACTTSTENAYLTRLNQSFAVPIEYRRVVLEGG